MARFTILMDDDVVAGVDSFSREQEGRLSRAQAIQVLVKRALAAEKFKELNTPKEESA